MKWSVRLCICFHHWWFVPLSLWPLSLTWCCCMSFPVVGSISCHHLHRTTTANYFSAAPMLLLKSCSSMFSVYYSWKLHQPCSRLWRHVKGSCFYSYVLLTASRRGAGRVLSNNLMLRNFKSSPYMLRICNLSDYIFYFHFLYLAFFSSFQFQQ